MPEEPKLNSREVELTLGSIDIDWLLLVDMSRETTLEVGVGVIVVKLNSPPPLPSVKDGTTLELDEAEVEIVRLIVAELLSTPEAVGLGASEAEILTSVATVLNSRLNVDSMENELGSMGRVLSDTLELVSGLEGRVGLMIVERDKPSPLPSVEVGTSPKLDSTNIDVCDSLASIDVGPRSKKEEIVASTESLLSNLDTRSKPGVGVRISVGEMISVGVDATNVKLEIRELAACSIEVIPITEPNNTEVGRILSTARLIPPLGVEVKVDSTETESMRVSAPLPSLKLGSTATLEKKTGFLGGKVDTLSV